MCALDQIIQFACTFMLNLGMGRGYSVQIADAFESASGRSIPSKICDRRFGNVAEIYAGVDLAEQLLGWKAVRSIDDMCRDPWRWQSVNPSGYPDA